MKYLGFFFLFIVAFATFAVGGAHAAETMNPELFSILGDVAAPALLIGSVGIKLTNLDSAESIFFSRELEHIKSETYDVQYPELKARSVIPVSMDVDPGAEKITYEQYDHVGMAKVISAYSKKLPRADVKGKEFSSPIRSLGDSYGYSVQEIRAAKMAGKPLQAKKADAAKRAILELDNEIAFKGDSTHGLNGFLNHPNVPEVTIPADGTGSSKTWATKTADLMLRDLHLLANSVDEVSNGVEGKDLVLALPRASYNLAKSTMLGDNKDKSVLKSFLENNDFVKEVIVLNELADAGDSGTKRMMVYTKDKKKVSLEIPQDFEQFDPQPEGLEFVVPCHSRTGGVIFYYPLSAAYADGI
jgi:hypothetical protein